MVTGKDGQGRDDGRTRGHEYKCKNNRCFNNIKSLNNSWHKLEIKAVWVKNIHDFKGKLDERWYGDRTTWD